MGQGVDGGGIGLGGFYRFHHAFGLAARGRGDPRDEQDPLREGDEVGESAADAEARVAARWYRRFWSSCGASAVSRIVRTVTKVRAAAKITFTPPRRLSPGPGMPAEMPLTQWAASSPSFVVRVTNVWPWECVIMTSGAASSATACGVIPQAQNTGNPPGLIFTGSP